MVDSHAHLDSSRYDEDRELVLTRAYEAGVRTILSVGIGDGPDTMHSALEIAETYADHPAMPAIFVSAGIHPSEAGLADRAACDKLRALARNPKLVAIGEIGLDYYHPENPARDVQFSAFLTQMEIAASLKKPIIIHCRTADSASSAWDNAKHDAWEDTLVLLEHHWKRTGLGGVLHCFGGTLQHARRGLELGFHISFAGNVTFPKAQPLREIAATIPAGHLLIETDSPFLAPIPFRGKRNEPAHVVRVAQTLAGVRGIDTAEIAALTTDNFTRLFVPVEHTSA